MRTALLVSAFLLGCLLGMTVLTPPDAGKTGAVAVLIVDP